MIQTLLIYFFMNPSVSTVVSYSVEKDAIIIEGLDKNEYEDYDIATYYGELTINPEVPKVIGSYKEVDAKIIFTPKYGFSEGASYTVLIISARATKRFVVEIPKEEANSTTTIVDVYPTAERLPMNQLKLYIAFSAPMKIGNAFDHVHLVKLPDRELESEAFLVTPDELWDPEKRRITILFDPGRIKRGIQPNLQLGLPLMEGSEYELVIDQGWMDVNGAKLVNGHTKKIIVGAVDRTSPNPENWIIIHPEPGKNKVLSIDFKESIDYALLHSAIVIVDEEGKRVGGVVTLSDNERIWSFTPEGLWQRGNYEIIISSKLEDLAGNNLSRKFDIDLNDPKDAPKSNKNILIPFVVESTNEYQNKVNINPNKR